MKKISEVPNPIVGKFYLVPCVEVLSPYVAYYKKGEFAPMMGEPHTDSEIGVNFLHYHYDWRFVNLQKQGAAFFMNPYSPAINLDPSGRGINPFSKEIVCKKKRLRRLTVDFPGFLAKTLEPLYRESALVDCRTCPHRGFDLGNIPPGEDGNVICPGHGLKWDKGSGRMVPRSVAV